LKQFAELEATEIFGEDPRMILASNLIVFFISHHVWRSIRNKGQSLKVANLFGNVVYRYSNANTKALWRAPLFRTMFRHFLETGEYERFASRDSTLNQAPSVYFKRIEELMNL